jgi:hypothetical protein
MGAADARLPGSMPVPPPAVAALLTAPATPAMFKMAPATTTSFNDAPATPTTSFNNDDDDDAPLIPAAAPSSPSVVMPSQVAYWRRNAGNAKAIEKPYFTEDDDGKFRHHADNEIEKPFLTEDADGTFRHHADNDKALEKRALVGGFADAVGPAWTRGGIEAPVGTENRGSWKAAVYTREQQTRLGVDAQGNKKSSVSGPSDAVDDDERIDLEDIDEADVAEPDTDTDGDGGMRVRIVHVGVVPVSFDRVRRFAQWMLGRHISEQQRMGERRFGGGFGGMHHAWRQRMAMRDGISLDSVGASPCVNNRTGPLCAFCADGFVQTPNGECVVAENYRVSSGVNDRADFKRRQEEVHAKEVRAKKMIHDSKRRGFLAACFSFMFLGFIVFYYVETTRRHSFSRGVLEGQRRAVAAAARAAAAAAADTDTTEPASASASACEMTPVTMANLNRNTSNNRGPPQQPGAFSTSVRFINTPVAV